MFSVTIEFGDNPETRKEHPFQTQQELNAFLDGVESALGWMDYRVVDKQTLGYQNSRLNKLVDKSKQG